MPWKKQEEMFIYKCRKICVSCELKLRIEEVQRDGSGEILRANPNYSTEEAIQLQMKRDNKGRNHANRARGRQLAIQKIKEMTADPNEHVSEPRRKALLSSLTKEYAAELCSAIRKGGLWEAYMKAGQRAIKNTVLQQKVNQAYDDYLRDPSYENLKVLERLEDEVEDSEIYEACGGNSRLLHMVDYVNVKDTEDCFMIYDMCRAKLGCGITCGIYIPSYYWDQPNKDRERYYCGVQWEYVVKVDNFIKQRIEKEYGTLENLRSIMPQCGCGAKYVPWARGESQVVEVCVSGRNPRNPKAERWIMFMADRLPQELDDEIKKVQSTGDHFIKAWQELSDEDILESIRKVYPREQMQIDPVRLPGVARFPVDEWKRDGQPCLDKAGWGALCMKIATNDLKNLQGIFDLGKTYTEIAIEAERKKPKFEHTETPNPKM